MTEKICVVRRQIPIPDVCLPLLNFSISQILKKQNSSIIDSSCSSVPRIILYPGKKYAQYTRVTNDEFITMRFKRKMNLRSVADDKSTVTHCILDKE